MDLFHSRQGHFLLESGHHGDLWLDLESLCLRPARLQPFAVDLAERLRPYKVDVICGPLVEGAFVGMMVVGPHGNAPRPACRLAAGCETGRCH